MVFNGRVYETDGAEAKSVHEADAVKPLLPVPRPGSLRYFPAQTMELEEEPTFFYGNPGALVGASTIVNVPERVRDLGFEPYLAAVLVSGGYDVETDLADDLILGISIMISLVDRNAVREGRPGAARDLGAALGPVLTTPDELDDFLASQEFGRAYRLEASARVNGVERARGNAETLSITFAEAIAAASRSCTLHEGDVFALGPLCEIPEDLRLEGGDEVNVAVENLGALSLKISLDV